MSDFIKTDSGDNIYVPPPIQYDTEYYKQLLNNILVISSRLGIPINEPDIYDMHSRDPNGTISIIPLHVNADNLLYCCEQEDRIKVVNGVLIDRYVEYRCNYCLNECEPYQLGYYCYCCQKDMCHLCYGETTEEIAIANGAKNYHLRKDALDTCRSHGEYLKRTLDRYLYNCDGTDCNLIDYNLKDHHNRNKNKNSNLLFMYPRYTNIESNFDLCNKCYGTNPHRDDMIYVDGECGFGSLKDWIILAQDQYFNAILCNLNPNSKYYKNFGFKAVDGHGRSGYYNYVIDTTIEELLVDYVNAHTSSYAEGIEGMIDINCCLTRMMLKRHMQTYYG
jgi:hypothetical protein